MTAIKEKKTKTKGLSSGENMLALYFNEIGKIPLLSREEEDEAARAAARGDEEARKRLVNANLRFVVRVAKKYQGQGIPLADLISEGNLGLLNAADRYDVDKGYHFISYAVWWIRQAILKAIYEKSRMIRLPVNRANEVMRVKRARKQIIEQHNVEKEIQEIADLLEMDTDQVKDIISFSKDMISLEHPVSPGRGFPVVGDYIEDMRYGTPEQNAVQNALENDIEEILGTLNKKEASVIRYRFGLGESGAMSLKEIGAHFHLSKERIRQIEQKALLRLQHPARSRKLSAYVA
jgi:RNA polymerase primary sigma factor